MLFSSLFPLTHGRESMHSVCYAKAILTELFPLPRLATLRREPRMTELFPLDARTREIVSCLRKIDHGT